MKRPFWLIPFVGLVLLPGSCMNVYITFPEDSVEKGSNLRLTVAGDSEYLLHVQATENSIPGCMVSRYESR